MCFFKQNLVQQHTENTSFVGGGLLEVMLSKSCRYPAILVTSAVVVLSNAKLSPTQLAHGGQWCGISYTQIEYGTENSGALLSQLGVKQLWLQQLYFVAKCMHGWDSYSYDKWVTSIVLRYAQNH